MTEKVLTIGMFLLTNSQVLKSSTGSILLFRNHLELEEEETMYYNFVAQTK